MEKFNIMEPIKEKKTISFLKTIVSGNKLTIAIDTRYKPNKHIGKLKSRKILGIHIIPDTIPRNLVTETRTKSWLGNGFQNDDINCISEYQVSNLVYDKQVLAIFIKECIHYYPEIKELGHHEEII